MEFLDVGQSEYSFADFNVEPGSFDNSIIEGVDELRFTGITENLLTEQPTLSETNLSKVTEFTISYETEGGGENTFYFTLLPAVDDGNETTSIPEIKPGILKKTNMEIKRFQIPGWNSAFQMLGVRETILQCVGLFIGNETFSAKGSAADAYDPLSLLNAYKVSQEFDDEIVQRGTICKLTLTSKIKDNPEGNRAIEIEHKCFVQNYRYFINRDDRVWYALDLLILDYTPGGEDTTGELVNLNDPYVEPPTSNSPSNSSPPPPPTEGQLPMQERLENQENSSPGQLPMEERL